MSTSADDQVFLSALASHYDLAQCEGWHLLQQHLELASGFAFIYIQVPDEWGARLLHQHLPDILPAGSSVQRIIFDPTAPVGSLAEKLLGLPPLTPGTAVLWVAAEPQSTLSHQQVENAWHDALARLNRYRNTLQATLPCTLAIVAPASILPLLREAAPDLWSIRSTVIRIEPRSRQATAMIFMRDDDRLKIEQAFAGDSGDPASTLEAVANLRSQPGREALLIPLLHRAGNQAKRSRDWSTAQSCLEEAWDLADSHGTDPLEKGTLANDLSLLFQDMALYDRAEFYAKRFLEIATANFAKDHRAVPAALNNLAHLFRTTNRLAEAEPLMRRALEIDEDSFGADHPNVARHLNNLAILLQDTNRLAEAEPLMRRALKIVEASFGSDHPSVARELNNLAQLLQATNRLAEAEPLMRRALKIDEASLGTYHPDVARDLNNLAHLFRTTNRLAEAEPLMRRALEIDEASYGPDHPQVAIRLNNLAALLQDTNRLVEAEPLSHRMMRIFLLFQRHTGHEHPHFDVAIGNYAAILEAQGLNEEAILEKVKSLKAEVEAE